MLLNGPNVAQNFATVHADEVFVASWSNAHLS